MADVSKPPRAPTPPEQQRILDGWEGLGRERPRVSIVCHCFNHAEFLSEALDGFLSQTTDFPFEIIVHDDASTDKSRLLILDYARRYPALVRPVLQETNQYSRGVKPWHFTQPRCKGAYIAFCEGDDYWTDTNKLQTQVDFLDKNEDYALTYTDAVAIQDGVVLDREFGGARRDLTKAELKRQPSIFTLTACFRNVLDAPPELAVIVYEDLFMWSRLGAFGRGKYMSELKPACYRVHQGGIHSAATRDQRYANELRSLAGVASYYRRQKNQELSAHFEDRIAQRVFTHTKIDRRLIPQFAALSHGRRIIGRLKPQALIKRVRRKDE